MAAFPEVLARLEAQPLILVNSAAANVPLNIEVPAGGGLYTTLVPMATLLNVPALDTSGQVGNKVQTRYLAHTADQQAAITRLYKDSRNDHHVFARGDDESQRRAQEMLRGLGLDRESRLVLENRWNVQWSNSWPVEQGSDSRRRTLFQCACGYNPKARQDRESKKQPSATGKAWERRVPFDFTGCIAHVEVIERCSDGEITRIIGCFAHNAECQSATLKRLPAVPLHEHVYEVAIEQMEAGASITGIQARNRMMMEKKEYHGMQDMNPKTANVRYHLLPTDNTTLYRKFSRRHGVDTRKAPQYNIDDWLNPLSPHFRPEIRDAIFHYGSRSEAGERFKVCISTQEMKKAAWKYAHHSQLVLDGTFGICTSQLLLFIALARDEHGKGVPIAFFLFSAPTGNRATHAGYNTAILKELISYWKDYLGKHDVTGDDFAPYVVITDTDTKERAALLIIWPVICLLLCKFHLRQCWTNHRKTAIRGNKGSEYWKDWVVNAIRSIEVQLIATIDHAVALNLIVRQREAFVQMSLNPSADSFAPAQGGIKHLDYLVENWMPLAMWQSWSEWGRITASALLKIPVEGVIPTTNHLESFNAILKRKHLAAWLHSGHRLRFDFLINILITRILPGIYSHRKSQQEYKDWLAERFRSHARGANLAEIHAGLAKDREEKRNRPMCWWRIDPVRDAGAEQLVRISPSLISVWRVDANTYIGRCHSTAPFRHVVVDPAPLIYEIQVQRSGIASCSCGDFLSRGGACKHLRAIRLFIESWITGGHETPFVFPKSLLEAQSILGNDSFESLAPPGSNSFASLLANPSPLSFDPTIIQSLGQDTTTLDDQEGNSPSDEESFDSDISMVGDGNNERVQAADPSARDQITKTLHHSAIAGQVQKRVDYDVKHLLPSLHGLANTLSDAHSLLPTPDLHELLKVLSTIQLGLDSVFNSEAKISGPMKASHTVLNQTTTLDIDERDAHQKRRHVLLPPSPERRQKRKDSHAPF